MSDSTETPGLAAAREALAKADAGQAIPARWHVYCPFGHHVSTWEANPGEDGLRQRCTAWDEYEGGECSDANPGEEREDNSVQHIPASHYTPTQVDKGHLAAALAEVDRLTADLSALRIEHEAVCGLLTHTRRDRDDARDETTRLWGATEADRARMAELEARGQAVGHPQAPARSCATCRHNTGRESWTCPTRALTWAEKAGMHATETEWPAGAPACPSFRVRA